LSLELPRDDTWPFGGHTDQRITVANGEIVLELAVTAADRRFPAVIGWHPWFRKPDTLAFHPTAMYRRVEGIAVDERIDVQPGPWDDCFVNVEPVIVTIDDVTVRLTSECTEWVVYDEPEHATCIEPQSGPPDAFNVRPHMLEPGQTLHRSFRIGLTR
jgi:aldose 1-epimerase